ncbi:chemotaxis protein [Basfia succiniciproducens]|uniref:chemotaxis protein n=1 Tax=Basfia succiniciproducens TaxID=653940 RepID=UPI003FCDAB86
MFGFLTLKEKGILLIGPIVLVCIILFQGWQARHWRAEAIKEEQLKLQWESQYSQLADSVNEFNKRTEQLTQAITQLQASQEKRTTELKNALQKNENWSNERVPDDISRLFNQRKTAH